MEWYTRYIRPLENKNYTPGTWYNSCTDNQSLAGAVNRMFTTTMKRTAKGDLDIVPRKSVFFSPTTLRIITLLLYAIVTLPSAYALLCVRRRQRLMAVRMRDKPHTDAIEFSIIFLLMLLLSPNSSRGHFGLMFLPALLIGRIAVSEQNRSAWTLLLLATFVSLISYNTPLRILFLITLWLGAASLVAVLLLAGCIMILLKDEPGLL